MNSSKKAFTLVELIIVIAIIAILAAAIFVAIDPARRLNEARNATRNNDITSILDAVKKYQADNDGTHYTTVDSITAGNYHMIGTAATGCDSGCTYLDDQSQTYQAACVNLSSIGSNYLATIPKDPKSGTNGVTDYYITKDTNGAITVGSCEPEAEGAGGTGSASAITTTR